MQRRRKGGGQTCGGALVEEVEEEGAEAGPAAPRSKAADADASLTTCNLTRLALTTVTTIAHAVYCQQLKAPPKAPNAG